MSLTGEGKFCGIASIEKIPLYPPLEKGGSKKFPI
jgi:hypothetical protein